MRKSLAIYPGTFDPVHSGHLDLMYRACAIFDRLIVAVFDHGRPSKTIVFSVEERVAMIEAALGDHQGIEVTRYSGLTVDFAREVEAQVIVRGLRVFSGFRIRIPNGPWPTNDWRRRSRLSISLPEKNTHS